MTASPITLALLALSLGVFAALQVAVLAVAVGRRRQPGPARLSALAWSLVPALVVGLLVAALAAGPGAPW
jgi:hypothetical protein